MINSCISVAPGSLHHDCTIFNIRVYVYLVPSFVSRKRDSAYTMNKYIVTKNTKSYAYYPIAKCGWTSWMYVMFSHAGKGDEPTQKGFKYVLSSSIQHVYVVMLHNDGYPYFMLSFRVALNREDLIPCDISPRVYILGYNWVKCPYQSQLKIHFHPKIPNLLQNKLIVLWANLNPSPSKPIPQTS